ncbi:L-aspartate dehydrogenase [Compostibacillus humi]|uniref:L-aspartate dehydrogenase n=1 Tax=Compostibacillus humi TaxID=1245525 RepID=A0A8J2ZTL9_9BACI|nr:aspartate dehydrogenase [Compostibacillus humi]GGH75887.1 L-aspartate dehydrogenase [Compostibacillus humi]
MNIGLIGAGAIANFLLEELNGDEKEDLCIRSIFVRNKEKYRPLESKYDVTLFTDLQSFLQSEMDIVVEAANVEAAKTLLPAVIKKKDAVLISIGALADAELLAEVTELAMRHGHTLHLPSGAIGGLDLLQNANIGSVSSVSLTTRKPAGSLIAEDIDEAKVVFEGNAADAIKQFPKNINVSIILSLAGIGAERTKVKIVADPHTDKNIHQVEMTGDFGEAVFTITNNPFPDNPKTSYLAAMSILGTLKRMNRKVRVGG